MNSPRKHKSKIREEVASSGDKIRRARLPKRLRIAYKIANAIDALDLNNKVLADKLGKYQSEISKWLKGDHNFTIDTLSDIEEILGIKLIALDDSNSSTVIKMPINKKNIANNVSITISYLKDKNLYNVDGLYGKMSGSLANNQFDNEVFQVSNAPSLFGGNEFHSNKIKLFAEN